MGNLGKVIFCTLLVVTLLAFPLGASDGSDGIITYTIKTGDIDEPGEWQICARVNSGTAVLTSEWNSFNVREGPT